MKKLSYLLLLTLLVLNNSCSKDEDDVDDSVVTGIIKGTFEFNNYPVHGVSPSVGAIISGISYPYKFTYTNKNGTISAEHVYTELSANESGKTHSFETYKDAHLIGISVNYFSIKEDSNFTYTITFEFKGKNIQRK